MTITSQFPNMTESYNFFDVVVLLLSSLVTGSSLMSISLLVLELCEFTVKELIRNPETGNTHV